MKGDLDYIGSETNSEPEKNLYKSAVICYQELEFILYAKNNYDKLTTEELDKMEVDIIGVQSRRRIFKSELGKWSVITLSVSFLPAEKYWIIY